VPEAQLISRSERHKTKDLWEKALTVAPPDVELDESFYREEWDRVIQAQSVETLDDYQKATRVGRGTRVSRKQRKQVWPVFEEYRALLNEAGTREAVDAMRDARRLLETKGAPPPFRAVVVDEAQDMGLQAFMLLRALVPEDDHPCLFIVGDTHQRIYRHKVVLGRCGSDIRGRGKKLKINYRTTVETRRWSVKLLEGVPIDDLDDGRDDNAGYRSLLHGTEPRVEHFASFEQGWTPSLVNSSRSKPTESRSLDAVSCSALTNWWNSTTTPSVRAGCRPIASTETTRRTDARPRCELRRCIG
jgi:hypothetical protein